MQYTQDYDESYPKRWYDPGYSWRQVVQSYIKSSQVFSCPSNSEKSVIADAAQTANGMNYPAITRSYACNDRIISDGGWNNGKPYALAQVNTPAQKILICEMRWQNWQDYGSSWWNGWGWDTASCQHTGTVTYAMADGHVKAMKPTSTATPFNMWGGMENGTYGNSHDVNVDGVEPSILNGLRGVEQNQCQ